MLLTERQRDAYQLYRRGMKQCEIAALMGISRVAANRLIGRARRRVQGVKLACATAGGSCQFLETLLARA